MTAGPGGLEAVQRAVEPLKTLGWEVSDGGGGADIDSMRSAGVPQIGVRHDVTRYFDWHHSPADTLDKVDPAELARSSGALAALTWRLAEAPDVLPRLSPASRLAAP